MTIRHLLGDADVASVLAEARSRPPLRFESRAWTGGGRTAITSEGDAAYRDGRLDRPGPRRRLWMSDDQPWQVEVGPAPGEGRTGSGG